MQVLGSLKWAGIEQFDTLPVTGLFEGRMVQVDGTIYTYNQSAWRSPPGILPAINMGTDGQFLSNDGTNAIWAASPSGVPPVDGSTDGLYLSNDGTDSVWVGVDRSAISGSQPDYVLINDGTGLMSAEQYLDVVRGGTGVDGSALTPGVLFATGSTFTTGLVGNGELDTGINVSHLADGSVANSEFQYLAGVIAPIQTSLNAKLDLAGGTLTGPLLLAANPLTSLGAATKQYVDSVAQGLTTKAAVHAATTANITLSGLQTIDGISVLTGERVLVKNQSTAANNGIYLANSGAWARANDMDVWAEFPSAYCFVQEGTTQADTGWVCTSDINGTLGVTAVTFVQFSGAGTLTTDGQGIEITGTVLSLELDGTTLSKSGTGLKVNALGITNAEVSASAGIVITKLATFTSLQLLTQLTDETGTGSAVFATTPTLVTPILGVASATSINKVAITAPATSATLTIADGKTLTASNTLIMTATDGSTAAFGTGGTVAYTANNLGVFGATTSAQLAGVISDETGTGALVFGTSPTIGAPNLTGATDYTQTTTPTTPAASHSRFYFKSDGKPYYIGSDGVEHLVGTGSGSGDKNYIKNPNDAAANWTASSAIIAVTTETSSTFIPNNITQTSAIKIVGVSGSGGYVYTQWTQDITDYNWNSGILWAQKYAGTAGDYTVQLWTNTAANYSGTYTQVTLSTSSIPAANTNIGPIAGLSGGSGTQYMELRIVRTAAVTTALYLNAVTYTPNPPAQGAAISASQAWTTTLSNAGNAVAYLQYERVGSNMVGRGTIVIGSSLPTGTIGFTIPPNITADYSGFPKGATNTDAYQRIGYASSYSAGGKSYFGAVQRNNTSSTGLQISGSGAVYGTNQDWQTTAPITWANGDVIMINCTIPIAEWVGNGTVNLGPGAQVEYVFNTSTADSTDSTSFGYGPGGVLFGSYTTATRLKRVRFQYAIQPDDLIVLEVLDSGLQWVPYETTVGASISTTTGMAFTVVNSTDIDVMFGSAGYAGTVRTGAAAWSVIAGTFKWRVRKCKASAPTGFGLAGVDGSAGLYMAGRAPGIVTGTAIAAGYVGEKITWTTPPATTTTVTTTLTDWANATFTLTPGAWMIYANITARVSSGAIAANESSVVLALTNASNTVIQNQQKQITVSTPSAGSASIISVIPLSCFENISTSTTYKLRWQRVDSAGTGSGTLYNTTSVFSDFYAVRIA